MRPDRTLMRHALKCPHMKRLKLDLEISDTKMKLHVLGLNMTNRICWFLEIDFYAQYKACYLPGII